MSQFGDNFKLLADAARDSTVSIEEFERALNQLSAAWPDWEDDDIDIVRRRFGSVWVARHIFRDNLWQAVERCWYHEWSSEDLKHAIRKR